MIEVVIPKGDNTDADHYSIVTLLHRQQGGKGLSKLKQMTIKK